MTLQRATLSLEVGVWGFIGTVGERAVWKRFQETALHVISLLVACRSEEKQELCEEKADDSEQFIQFILDFLLRP